MPHTSIILRADRKYPALLKKIGQDAPAQIYYKGTWDSEIFKNCLAVVGSRRMTSYGKEVIQRLVGQLSAAGITVVSGFMYGCDAQAHKTAVNFGGRTIAVMACGIERVHPQYQKDLYREILNNNGLILSEYERDALPLNWMYPRRNRIVAGLAKAVLVVEAALNSGSLITARWAKKFGRKIFVVPGPITSENSKGIMRLIREGAEAVESAQDILPYYKLEALGSKAETLKQGRMAKREVKGGLMIEQEILEKLRLEAASVDDLARALGKGAAELGFILSVMELQGKIKKQSHKYYVG